MTRPGGKPTKQPDCSTKNAAEWRTWSDVQSTPMSRAGGIGLVTTHGIELDGGSLIPIDIDACVDPSSGEISDWALEILAAYDNSYTQVSPSGTGLRLFVCVENPPLTLHRSKVRVPHPAPPGVDKTPEVQVFGLGSAQFIAWSDVHLDGTSDEILSVPDLDWLVDRFDLGIADEVTGELPAGEGEPPGMGEVLRGVLGAPGGEALVDGRWHDVLPDASASEAFHRLAQHTLRAAHGHGNLAVNFLLTETAWGRGQVEDSADPVRYTRREWVESDVARIGWKAPAPTGKAFESFAPPPPSLNGSAPKGEQVGRFASHLQFLAGRRSTQYLVKGLLPRSGLAQVFGDPASGKTPIALSLALHVAAGRQEWFGRKVARHGPVVYMIGEDDNGLAWRATAEQQRLGIDPASLEGRMAWSRMPGRFNDPDDAIAWIAETLKLFPDGVALFVIDTQAMNFGDGDENATKDMNQFARNLVALVKHLGCCVLLVHHTGHGNKERARGSSVLFGALDACFEISRSGTMVTATSTKAKNWTKPEPLVGSLVPVEVGTDEDGDPITAITLDDTEPDPADVFAEVTDELDDAMLAVLKVLDETEPKALREIGEATGLPDTGRALRRAIGRLEELGLARQNRAAKSPPSTAKQGRVKVSYLLSPAGVRFLADGPPNNERECLVGLADLTAAKSPPNDAELYA